MGKVSKDTIARTVCLFLALINQFLAIYGKERLPFAEDEMYQFVSILVTIITSCAAWWKNNSFTPEAIYGDECMNKRRAENHDE